MRNKFLLQYIILTLLLSGLIATTNINATALLKTAYNLEKINQIDEALNIYIKLFNNDKSNQEYFKKIKKILLEKKLYEKLIIIYEEHISNIEESEDNFFIEIELLEIKIWNFLEPLDYLIKDSKTGNFQILKALLIEILKS